MDNNELGTNLAEVGTDCSEFPNNSDAISRQQVLEALGELATFTEDWSCHTWMYTDDVYNAIKQLPPIQPEIVRCEECLYRKICSWEKQGAKFCSFAERREDEH